MGIVAGAIALMLAAAAGDTPAEPQSRRAPDYPAACMPAPGETKAPQTVIVAFTVNREGLPENVRVRESSDACFNDAAVAAVRGWRYVPARVDGSRAPEEVEATFTFVLAGDNDVVEYDATPIFRMPPAYPQKCESTASRSESVILEFDVTAEGTTENIRVIESTSPCFEKSAMKAVGAWKYRPKLVGGKPVARAGVQTTITYELSFGRAREARLAVGQALMRAQRLVKQDPQKALTELAEIEAKYGDSFTPKETSMFHQVRAQARIETGDYRGALDDLRVVQRMGRTGAQGEAIANAVKQLEAMIAAEDAAAAKKTDAPAAEETGGDPPEEPQ